MRFGHEITGLLTAPLTRPLLGRHQARELLVVSGGWAVAWGGLFIIRRGFA
jgi:hypothetical protein